MSRKSALYLGTYDPSLAVFGGGGWTDRRVIELLNQIFDVQLAAVTGERSSAAESRYVCEPLTSVPLQIRSQRVLLLRVLGSMIATGQPYLASKYRLWRKQWRLGADRLKAISHSVDLVVTNGWPALLLCADAGVRPDFHVAQNVEAIVAKHYSPFVLRALREEGKLAALELELLRLPRVVRTLGEHDAKYFASRGIPAETLVLPLRELESIPSTRTLRVGFIGSTSWPPNARALEQFMGVIVPALQRYGLGFEVVLAGAGTERFGGQPGVIMAGPIESQEWFFRATDLQVVPREGEITGISVKLLEGTEFGVQAVAPSRLCDAHLQPCPWFQASGIEQTLASIEDFQLDPHTARERLRAYRELTQSVATLRTMQDLRTL